MIESLKTDEIAHRVGGRFKLCALIQRRLVELMDGSRPLIDRKGRSDLELAVEEINQGLITWELPADGGSDPEMVAAFPDLADGKRSPADGNGFSAAALAEGSGEPDGAEMIGA